MTGDLRVGRAWMHVVRGVRGAGLSGLVVLLIGCAPLVPYTAADSSLDQGAQQLQHRLAMHWAVLEHAPKESLSFQRQHTFYLNVQADIEMLTVRAQSLSESEETLTLLHRLRESLAYLILLHKQCVSSPLTDAQRARVIDRGADMSMDCHMTYGATEDAAGRGRVTLNRAVIPLVREIFNLQLGALMRLEASKQRSRRWAS